MASLEQFSINIGQIAKDLTVNADKVVRAVALAADAAIVTATPVDTGRARSNWLVELDVPASGTRQPYAPGSKLGRGESANLQAALNQAGAKVGQFNGGKNNSIHITNNLPYIGALNDGSSKQAPANFVQAGIQAAVAKVRASKLVRGG